MAQDPERLSEMDRVARQIDRARQEQGAHVYACREPECGECRRLQRALDKLYRRYAHLCLYRECHQEGA